jgi:hypothetical protein
VRCIGIIGIFAALLAVSANAADAKKPCFGLLDENGKVEEPLAQARHPPLADNIHPLMTDNECEAVKRHQLQMRLLEIPQEGEDPMGLSLGSKDKGGMFYFKIPFSF